MSEGFVVRGLRRVRKLLESPGPLELEGKHLGRVRDLLRECAGGCLLYTSPRRTRSCPPPADT